MFNFTRWFTEKLYPNRFLKDAINNRSIRTSAIRFSHDRSTNGTNDASATTNGPKNDSTAATDPKDKVSDEVRENFEYK